ncbi:hypothetical protein [Clostridium taeniosporum]|uniref:Uncharacterized protein n=1 Tax=Clostridium taeniosporum TaxID=394958 RepID=A0A1D7XP89_9CLOT|nr:hypothetical protein [Clostridium taeniosporum]AOR25136.1 hypothetical protein BGI42_15450 [Clostridium taeniosporum]
MIKKYLAIILIIFIFCITGCSKSNSNIKNYLNSSTLIDSRAKDIMPNLDDLPKYQNIEYKYTHKSMLIFESDSVALIVNYDDTTYKNEKDKLDKKYNFLDQKVKFDYDENNYVIPENEFSINSYTFKVVAGNEKDNTEFPKSFGMIGTSEDKKSIAYLYFYDSDLDYIGTKDDKSPMANFVKEYFKYDF